MNKKDKFYLLLLILSVASLAVSAISKVFGSEIFDQNLIVKTIISKIPTIENESVQYVVNGIFISIQYYLIVGCSTLIAPKRLFEKMGPYFPFVFVMLFLPKELYFTLNFIMLFATAFAISTKFQTVKRFAVNSAFLIGFQLMETWLRFGVAGLAISDTAHYLTLNIDITMFLILLYYLNRKVVK